MKCTRYQSHYYQLIWWEPMLLRVATIFFFLNLLRNLLAWIGFFRFFSSFINLPSVFLMWTSFSKFSNSIPSKLLNILPAYASFSRFFSFFNLLSLLLNLDCSKLLYIFVWLYTLSKFFMPVQKFDTLMTFELLA